MTHVDIREVALRDGLQIEKPIPLSAKLELLARADDAALIGEATDKGADATAELDVASRLVAMPEGHFSGLTGRG